MVFLVVPERGCCFGADVLSLPKNDYLRVAI
jgi:hypothetical protein